MVFSASGRDESASFSNAALFKAGAVPEQPIRSSVILVGGTQTTESAGRLEIRDKVVLFVPPAKPEPEALQQVLRVLLLGQAKAIVVLSDLDSAGFAASIPKRHPERTVIGSSRGRPAILEVQAAAVKNALAAAWCRHAIHSEPIGSGIARNPEVPDGHRDEGDGHLIAHGAKRRGDPRGTEPLLKNEYVVFSAHMDHIGISAGANVTASTTGPMTTRRGRRGRRAGRSVQPAGSAAPSGR